MRRYKEIENGYISRIGVGFDGIEITAEEYERIKKAISASPTSPEGYDYRLTESLEWELYELPPIDPVEEEISDSEALAIILGGDA